ncbi:MAG: hypothetical protein JWN48_5333 [Myxococcaceae bacterium]|nr:hypothetical protein [Myxococcaceae bacterium]
MSIESSSKLSEQLDSAAQQVKRAATDKSASPSERAQSVVSAAKTTAVGLADEAKARAEKLAPSAVDTAQSVAERAKHAIEQVKDEGTALVSEAREAAADAYGTARDYALDTAHEVSERTRGASRKVARYTQRASLATGRFASTHALPLTLLGASVGWLAWSIRQESRKRMQVRSPASGTPSYDYALEQRRPVVESRRPLPRTSGATTTGAKLMGVRVTDAEIDDLWTPSDR